MGTIKAAGTVCYVKDIQATSAFYKKLRFEVTPDDVDHLSARSHCRGTICDSIDIMF